MSEMEYHKGRLLPINLHGKTVEEFYEQRCKELGLYSHTEQDGVFSTNEGEYSSFRELYWEEANDGYGYYDYFEHNGAFYKVEDTELDPYGFSEGVLENDNSISYHMFFYNGGAGFGEMLRDVANDALDT